MDQILAHVTEASWSGKKKRQKMIWLKTSRDQRLKFEYILVEKDLPPCLIIFDHGFFAVADFLFRMADPCRS